MATATLSNWAANDVVDFLLSGSPFLACHDADPTPTGLTSTELASGGYRRQPIGFSSASNRGAVSVNPQVFTGLPAALVSYFAVWTALSGGHMIFAVELSPAIRVKASGQLRVAAGDIALLF